MVFGSRKQRKPQRVEICKKHQMFRMEYCSWVKTINENVDVTDLFDNADFIESTCPYCSSDEEQVEDLVDLFI